MIEQDIYSRYLALCAEGNTDREARYRLTEEFGPSEDTYAALIDTIEAGAGVSDEESGPYDVMRGETSFSIGFFDDAGVWHEKDEAETEQEGRRIAGKENALLATENDSAEVQSLKARLNRANEVLTRLSYLVSRYENGIREQAARLQGIARGDATLTPNSEQWDTLADIDLSLWELLGHPKKHEHWCVRGYVDGRPRYIGVDGKPDAPRTGRNHFGSEEEARAALASLRETDALGAMGVGGTWEVIPIVVD